jgi:hypothetical protein
MAFFRLFRYVRRLVSSGILCETRLRNCKSRSPGLTGQVSEVQRSDGSGRQVLADQPALTEIEGGQRTSILPVHIFGPLL